MPENRNPDISNYPEGRHGYPVLPPEELENWEPIRPIIAENNYDIAYVFNSGWTRRIANPTFTGNGNPALAVIHKSIIPDLHQAMGGSASPAEDAADTLLGHWETYLEDMGDADEAFGEAIDKAQEIRDRARRDAETRMLERLVKWEKKFRDV